MNLKTIAILHVIKTHNLLYINDYKIYLKYCLYANRQILRILPDLHFCALLKSCKMLIMLELYYLHIVD